MFNTRIDPLEIGGRNVYLLREDENPYGSHKAYAAAHYLKSLPTLKVRNKSAHKIFISSSGRMAEAIARMTLGRNFRIHIVTDKLSSTDIIASLSAFSHVTVEVVDQPDETGSHIKARFQRLEEIKLCNPLATFIDQYNDPRIADGYRFGLGPHLSSLFPNGIGAVFCPGGTGGLANGLCRYRNDLRGDFNVFVADAEGSALMRNPPAGVKRILSGIGNGIQTGLIKECLKQVKPVWVKDTHSIQACHDLQQTGRMLGASSGATLAAYMQVASLTPELLPRSAPIVVICPDAGDAYRQTIYNPTWLRGHGINLAVAPSQSHSFCLS